MPLCHPQLCEQLAALVATTCQRLEALLQHEAAGQPAGAMLILPRNVGQVGIRCLGGLRQSPQGLLVCFRRSREGVPAATVEIGTLLAILAQLETQPPARARGWGKWAKPWRFDGGGEETEGRR